MVPKVHAGDVHELVKANELRSMACIAKLIITSVLEREESRGFVFREDFPLTDNINWLKWILISQKDKDNIQITLKEVPTPYIEPSRKKSEPV